VPDKVNAPQVPQLAFAVVEAEHAAADGMMAMVAATNPSTIRAAPARDRRVRKTRTDMTTPSSTF
jgi:hypothetical protein